MPRQLPATEELKAKNLVKPLLRNNLNCAATARELGVSESTIQEKFHRKPVQKTLQDTIDKCLASAGISQRKVYRRLDEQLDATRTISAVISPDGKQKDANGQTCDFVEVKDHIARDKAIEKSLTLMGHLKQNGKNGDTSGKGVFIYIIKDS